MKTADFLRISDLNLIAYASYIQLLYVIISQCDFDSDWPNPGEKKVLSMINDYHDELRICLQSWRIPP